MDLTTGIRLFLLLAGLVAPVCAAQAEETDTQLWLNTGAGGKIATDVNAAIDISERLREGSDQFLVRGTVEWKLSPHVTVGGGIAYVTSDASDEVRPHQYVTITWGQFSLRSQAEERFLSNEDRALIRLRERAQLLVPLSDRTKAVLSGEAFFILRPAKPTDTRDVEQYRAIAGLRHSFSPHVEGAASYMMIYAPRPGAPDKLSHVPQLSLAYKF